ncbi:MAG: hypothetical protein KDJ15_04090 [Alphaproteobacteria bacterium]|nr:hypothetical protein [Alphaproteobacteria bacterium]
MRQYLAAREVARPQDYGAVGDSVNDDTQAINDALAAEKAIYLPRGVYRITRPITMHYGNAILGMGDESVIQAQDTPLDENELPPYSADFNAIEIVEGYCIVENIKIVGGASALFLAGKVGPCVKNVCENITIWDAQIGVTLDGWNDCAKPCYWNNISRVLVARPQIDGVLLTTTPDDWNDPETFGDSPNADKFHDVRVYSLSAPMSGSGFFISTGQYNNSFVDCEANVDATAEACFRLGFLARHNIITNFYAESLGLAPGIRIDNGSLDNTIVRLFSATGGAAIWDPTLQGEYQAFDAGYPKKNFLKDAYITDVHIDGMTRGTTYIDPPADHVGDISIDLEHTFYLLSSFNKSYDLILPNAGNATGRWVTLKKSDLRENPINIKENGGPGPDNRTLTLLQRYDTVTLVSNGATWWVTQDNRMPRPSRYIDNAAAPSGTFQADMLNRVYLVSAYTGQIVFEIPSPAEAQGQVCTIKKIDPSGNAVKIQMAGGSGGPDAQIGSLTSHFAAITIYSDGGQWVVLSKY